MIFKSSNIGFVFSSCAYVFIPNLLSLRVACNSLKFASLLLLLSLSSLLFTCRLLSRDMFNDFMFGCDSYCISLLRQILMRNCILVCGVMGFCCSWEGQGIVDQV